MKRVAVILLTIAMLLSLTACKERNSKQSTTNSDKGIINNLSDKPEYSAINTDAVFPNSKMFIYDGGSNVPDYTVLPKLDNMNGIVTIMFLVLLLPIPLPIFSI